MKKKIYCLIALVSIFLLLYIIFSLQKPVVAFEKYIYNETSDFLEDYPQKTQEESEIYQAKGTFLGYDGEAYFIRQKGNHRFIKNAFEISLEEATNEKKLETMSGQILEKVKTYFEYDSSMEIECTSTDPDLKVDEHKNMYLALLDGEIVIHYSFYIQQKILEYTLMKKADTIYAIVQYNGMLP